MKNILTRAITGTIYVVLIVLALIINPIISANFFLFVSILGYLELNRLFKQSKNQPNVFIGLVFLMAFYILNFLISFNYININWFLILFPISAAIFIAELYRKKQLPFTNIALTFFCVIYIVIPFALISQLYQLFEPFKYLQKYLVLSIFILIWSSDTFAYLTGISIGKHKLFERISPKKSWEGFFGGLLGTVGISFLLHFLFPELKLWQWIGLAIIIDIAGTFGDLIESIFKRSINIKDSGNILPGHGGILDRFDSFIFALPLAFVYLKLVLLINL